MATGEMTWHEFFQDPTILFLFRLDFLPSAAKKCHIIFPSCGKTFGRVYFATNNQQVMSSLEHFTSHVWVGEFFWEKKEEEKRHSYRLHSYSSPPCYLFSRVLSFHYNSGTICTFLYFGLKLICASCFFCFLSKATFSDLGISEDTSRWRGCIPDLLPCPRSSETVSSVMRLIFLRP